MSRNQESLDAFPADPLLEPGRAIEGGAAPEDLGNCPRTLIERVLHLLESWERRGLTAVCQVTK